MPPHRKQRLQWGQVPPRKDEKPRIPFVPAKPTLTDLDTWQWPLPVWSANRKEKSP